MNPESLSFLFSLVSCHARPRRPFTDPFSSPVPCWGNVPEADSEAVSMPPLRRLRSCFFDDGPRSETREGDLANIRRKYLIHPSVGMRSPTEFEHAPDGGADEVSSFFCFCPSQLTPLTWRTLMAIQMLGELHGFSIGVHDILYSYYFAPLANKNGFFHLRSRDGAPLVGGVSEVISPSGMVGTADVSRPVSFAGEAVAKLIMGIPRRFRWVTFLVSREALRHSRVWGNVTRSPTLVVFDEYQKARARKRRLSCTPPPRLARAALSAGGLSSISSKSAEITPNRDLLADSHRRLTSEVLLLRGQVQDMMACRDLLIQQVRASARMWAVWSLESDLVTRRLNEDPGIIGDGGAWAPLGSLDHVWDPEVPIRPRGFFLRSGDRIGTLVHLDPEAFEAMVEPRGLDPEIVVWNPEEPRGSSLDPEIFDWNPEAIREPGGYRGTQRSGSRIETRSSLGTQNFLIFAGTVLRLPRQDYYRYLSGFRIMPLGSWPLSSSYDVFYFCMKSLTGLEGASVGVMTQVPGLRCFPRLEKQDLDCSMYFIVHLQ
ncbi:hypothetical protein F2Q70_00003793 [Brassica cretica]|uniref:Uncharacterized protein n=1 Tax=Brassica cretica TaxID=69181 RepID=A0A8S9J232_BRACR|nr:hypothetical protein F2Q70_00003793 [Brassica cretica]